MRQWYRALALLVLNTLVLFVLVNLVLYGVLLLRTPPPLGNPIMERYGKDAVLAAYPDLDEAQVRDLLEESWGRTYTYEPFTQFKERPHEGDFVNVSEHGFRVVADQGPWPPDHANLNVFFFGGSTAFGYGVADDQTVASYLQRFLDGRDGRTVRVYNFGRGHYYSSQERALFERLLVDGHAPDVAVFLDGLNEFFYSRDQPLFTPLLTRIMDGTEAPPPALLDRLPLTRAVRRLLPGEGKTANPAAKPPDREEDGSPAEVSERVIRRYLANQESVEAIAARQGVIPLFVWQPVPMYGYDVRHHRFAGQGFGGEHRHAAPGYAYFRDLLARRPLAASFLWAADLQADRREPLYVDQVHYSPAFSRALAEHIATQLVERGLLAKARGAHPPGS